MNELTIQLICVGIIVLTSVCLFYYIYQLVLIDAKSRGITRPKLWSIIAASGQNGSGLFLYLFKRRNTSSLLNKSENQKSLNIKRKIYCLMTVDLFAFLTFVAILAKGE